MKNCQKIWTQDSRSLEATGTDTDRLATYDFDSNVVLFFLLLLLLLFLLY